MPSLKHLLVALAVSAPAVNALSGKLGERKQLWEYTKQVEDQESRVLSQRDIDPSKLYPTHQLSVPVDHFHNESKYEPHSNAYFNLRYWFDASHYKDGGPVIVLQGGEDDGPDRLPYLQKGIVAELAQATNGIGVVLEHRYYGGSFPTPNLSVENLCFLTTQQALADAAYFAQHVKFPGLEHCGDLSSNSTAYISYGGSYAGAFSAFLRVLYPNVYWGSISSSGVTKAIYNYPQYYEAIAQYGPKACIKNQQTFIQILDNILIGKNNTNLPKQLKTAFGLPNITHVGDFATVLTSPMAALQALNWDPAISSPAFFQYCSNITSSNVLYPETAKLRPTVANLITQSGHTANQTLVTQMLNFIGYINRTEVSACPKTMTQDQCFGTYNQTFYQQDSLGQNVWRSWPYQYCTEWGFLQTADVPAGQLPIISRTMDLEYNTVVCRDAFNITSPSDVEVVNQYGGYNIAYPRLAFIGGEWDPWRPATSQGFGYGAKQRNSTTSQPFLLIPDAVHHWDENGLFANQTTKSLPPSSIVNVHAAEKSFVAAWVQEYHQQHKSGL